MEKTHYTYQITNNLTMQYYVGKRSTYAKSFEEDDYFGSSKVVDAEVLEYGIENFDMEPIEYHDTEDDCYDHEAVLVTRDTLNDPLCYNIVLGGRFQDAIEEVPVVSFDLKGNKARRWNSVTEARNYFGKKKEAISMCCLYKQKSFLGFQWRYESEVGDNIFIGPVKRKRIPTGNNTSKTAVLDLITMDVYDSKRSAASGIGFQLKWKSPDCRYPEFKNRFIPISKDEYKLFKELEKI